MRLMCMPGYTDDCVMRHGFRVSDRAYLQKPFTPEAPTRKAEGSRVLDAPDAPDAPEAPAHGARLRLPAGCDYLLRPEPTLGLVPPL